MGVGLLEGTNGMNATKLLYTAFGWVAAFMGCSLLTAAVFSICE